MKFRKRLAAVSLGLLMVLASGSANAAKPKDLQATGNTIGGPGVVTLDSGDGVTVFDFLGTSQDICVTVLVTKGSVNVQTGGFSRGISSGQSQTNCVDAPSAVSISCNSTKPCEAAWRVDGI